MPADGETRVVGGRKDRYNAKLGVWQTGAAGTADTGMSATEKAGYQSIGGKVKGSDRPRFIEPKLEQGESSSRFASRSRRAKEFDDTVPDWVRKSRGMAAPGKAADALERK